MVQQYRRRKHGCHRRYWSSWESLLLGFILLRTKLIAAELQEAKSNAELDSMYYYVGCFAARTDLLKESVYAKSPHVCVEICEHQTYSYAVLSAERCFCVNSFIAADRQADNLCNTRCLASKSLYCGGADVHSYYSTMLAKEPAPHNLRIINATENSMIVMWEAYEPRLRYKSEGGGPANAERPFITNFLIRSSVLHTYSRLPFFTQPEFIVQSSENRFEINDLHPGTEYNVSVEAMCGSNACGSASIIGFTVVGTPSPAPQQPQLIETKETTTTVKIPSIRNDNGPVTKVLVIVERVDDALSQVFDETLLSSWEKAQEDGLPYYITAELDYQRPDDANKTRLFVVGDGKRYGKYWNAPLDNNADHIHISLGVISSLNGVEKSVYTHSSHGQHSTAVENFNYATFETGKESIIALTVTCVVFASCLVLSVVTYFYLRYKTCQMRNSGVGRLTNTHEMALQQPIIERENNGFVVEDELPVNTESFKQQLNKMLHGLSSSMRLPRSALRLNVNDVLADGCFGEVISGTLIHVVPSSPDASHQCQMHLIALDDLPSESQVKLLKEFSNLSRLEAHEHVLHFYGVSASADWFYLIFEQQTVTLKRRLIESRRAPNTVPVQRITALSEQLVLQWIYEVVNAMQYLAGKKVVHRQLCSHNIFVTAEAKVKVSLFGPIPLVSHQKKVDISRWLAPESLRYQHFSSKSDVWALGCVAWECCTLGGTLYPNINGSQDLLPAIRGGARPAQPAFVYDDLYQLLLNCWQLEPTERTKYEDIALNVRQLMTSPKHALCFDRVPEPPDNHILDTLPFYLPMLEQYD